MKWVKIFEKNHILYAHLSFKDYERFRVGRLIEQIEAG